MKFRNTLAAYRYGARGIPQPVASNTVETVARSVRSRGGLCHAAGLCVDSGLGGLLNLGNLGCICRILCEQLLDGLLRRLDLTTNRLQMGDHRIAFPFESVFFGSKSFLQCFAEFDLFLRVGFGSCGVLLVSCVGFDQID